MEKEVFAVFMCLACGGFLVFVGGRSWVLNIKYKASSKTVDGTILKIESFVSKRKEGDPFSPPPPTLKAKWNPPSFTPWLRIG